MSINRPALLVRAGASAAGVMLIVSTLAGCVPSPSPPLAPSTTSASQSASPTASTPTPAPVPTLQPEGTATENLPFFTAITDKVFRGSGKAKGRAYIDALVAAGFDKTAMQVTQDKTTVGDPVESLQFSVLWAGECLVGQVGQGTGKPVTAVLPVLGDSTCLVGNTRPINW